MTNNLVCSFQCNWENGAKISIIDRTGYLNSPTHCYHIHELNHTYCRLTLTSSGHDDGEKAETKDSIAYAAWRTSAVPSKETPPLLLHYDFWPCFALAVTEATAVARFLSHLGFRTVFFSYFSERLFPRFVAKSLVMPQHSPNTN